jgi:hypothetical protein
MQQHSLLDAIFKPHSAGLPVTNQLQLVSREHPYFTAAQFFLLQQMKKDDAGYPQQAAKTALLFNNPYWLQFQLNQDNEPLAAVKETPVIAMYAENSDNDDDAAILVHETKTIIPETKDQQEEIPSSPAQQEELIAAPAITENSDNDDDAAILVHETETITTEPELQDKEELPTPAQQEELIAATALPENPDHDKDPAVLLNSPQEPGEIAADDTEQPEDTKTEQEMPSIKIDLAASIKEAENDHALSFEPMHLVDYFASQGIKLSDDIQTADKLGKQLKSFTEWLKTMKKVHVPDPETGAVTADVSIQTLAEKSNAEGEIVTEAMAEVFAQQGKTGKAIEVYKKLSLLNPLKSAFFAAKIEQLKGS